ncbi:MAG: HAD hydrolase-like protein [Chromatiales bacterium]|jgi:phosphoglycolate phosphatase
MYTDNRLIVLDADGTTVDAFSAINQTFAAHNMDIGEIERFQNRRHIFKYLGGLRELPKNLRHQFKGSQRSKLIATLTEIYREQAVLYEGARELINRLLEASDIRVGVVSRNITEQPEETLQQLYLRNGVDASAFDFFIHLPLKKSKESAFRAVRESFGVNPSRAFASGDEKKDFLAAVGCGMHPFMVSYGFESYERLTEKIGIPEELISRHPRELKQRILHTFDLRNGA